MIGVSCSKKHYTVSLNGNPSFEGTYKEVRKYLRNQNSKEKIKFYSGIDKKTQKSLESSLRQI